MRKFAFSEAINFFGTKKFIMVPDIFFQFRSFVMRSFSKASSAAIDIYNGQPVNEGEFIIPFQVNPAAESSASFITGLVFSKVPGVNEVLRTFNRQLRSSKLMQVPFVFQVGSQAKSKEAELGFYLFLQEKIKFRISEMRQPFTVLYDDLDKRQTKALLFFIELRIAQLGSVYQADKDDSGFQFPSNSTNPPQGPVDTTPSTPETITINVYNQTFVSFNSYFLQSTTNYRYYYSYSDQNTSESTRTLHTPSDQPLQSDTTNEAMHGDNSSEPISRPELNLDKIGQTSHGEPPCQFIQGPLKRPKGRVTLLIEVGLILAPHWVHSLTVEGEKEFVLNLAAFFKEDISASYGKTADRIKNEKPINSFYSQKFIDTTLHNRAKNQLDKKKRKK
jgi:hypothetical protein